VDLRKIFSVGFPIIAPIVVKPLPGSPGYAGDLETVVAAAVKDAKLLDEGGVDGLSFENLGDAPFFKSDAPPETIASLARVIGEVKRASSLPIGVNVLRNCASASLALSYAYGGKWIRVNVLTEAYVTDQGIVEGNAADVMRVSRSSLTSTSSTRRHSSSAPFVNRRSIWSRGGWPTRSS